MFKGESLGFLTILSPNLEFPFYPPTQETTTLAVKECLTPASHLFSIDLTSFGGFRSAEGRPGYGPSGQRLYPRSSIDRVRVI
jgi:hypothetical protein